MEQSNGIRDRVAVVGVGHTKFGRHINRPSLDMIVEAMQNALDDSGLRKDDIDGLCSNSGWPGSTDMDAVAVACGLELNWYGQTWTHGRFCAGAIQWSSFVIANGLANCVACIVGNGRPSRRAGGSGDIEGTRETGGGHGESPHYGMTSPGAGAALAAQRYFHKYGASSEQLAAVPIAFRKHASLNPNAIMRDPITKEDYLNSRWICAPLHLLDYSLPCNSGTCVILTSAERARSLRKPPVYVSGMQGLRAGRQEFIFGPPGLGILEQDEYTYRPKPEDLTVYRTAGMGPSEIGALYTYDAFSFLAWVALERFAFCGPGEAAAFSQDGRIEIGGELPINSNGGLISEGHASGWGHQIEIVRQLRGECGERQIPNLHAAMWGNSYGDALIYRN